MTRKGREFWWKSFTSYCKNEPQKTRLTRKKVLFTLCRPASRQPLSLYYLRLVTAHYILERNKMQKATFLPLAGAILSLYALYVESKHEDEEFVALCDIELINASCRYALYYTTRCISSQFFPALFLSIFCSSPIFHILSVPFSPSHKEDCYHISDWFHQAIYLMYQMLLLV